MANINPDKLPHSLETEQAVLGALIIDSDLIYRTEFLMPEHFYDPVHGRIYEVIVDMKTKGLSVDGIILHTRFHNDGMLKDIGGATYLAQLTISAADPKAIGDYARIIIDLHARRELTNLGQKIIKEVQYWEDSEEINGLIEEYKSSIENIQNGGIISDSTSIGVAGDLIKKERENKAKFLLTTGFVSVDSCHGKLLAGDLIIVAGRPSMGKTAMTLQMAYNQAKEGHGVHYDSLEMGKESFLPRSYSMAHPKAIPYRDIIFDKIDIEEKEAIEKTAEEMRKLPFYVNFKPGRTASQIVSNLRRVKQNMARKGQVLRVAYIDYLGLINLEFRKGDTKSEAIGRVTKILKEAAKTLQIAIVLLSQLSRNVELRDDKRPQLSDLRDSGEIEQDADVVIMVYRDHYYLVRKTPSDKDAEKHQEKLDRSKNKVEAIISKFRSGNIGSVELGCNIACNKFWDLGELF